MAQQLQELQKENSALKKLVAARVPLPWPPLDHPAGAGVATIRYTEAKKVAMSVDIQIEALSVAEKVQLLESVWESLCAHPGDMQSPEWHREVLEERRRRLEDGRATISSWTDAKARLMQLGE